MSQPHLPPSWIPRLEALLGVPETTEHTAFWKGWAKAEGGTADNNPMNTTYLLPGATDYNSAGVKNYPHPVVGLCATALTLILPDYAGLLGDLQSGSFTAAEIVERNERALDTWGTGAAAVLACL